MKISVLMPTYKGLDYIKESVLSVLNQDFKDFELIICNDSATDHSEVEALLTGFHDARIRFYKNEKNLGYPLNMRKCFSLAQGELLFLMAQDDIILKTDLFSQVVNIFNSYADVGVITRPYYWFETDVNTPIRYIPKTDKRIISTDDDAKHVIDLLETVGQFSGLVLKKSYLESDVSEFVFPAHIYPFLSIMRKYKCYFMEDFTIAVRTSSSQTRFLSSIYNPSPTKTWVDMFNILFPENKYTKFRAIGIDHICSLYVGLAQIKNYGYYTDLLRDLYYMIKYRKKNLLSLTFWFYAVSALIIPRFLLRKMVDYYKNVINKKRLKNLI